MDSLDSLTPRERLRRSHRDAVRRLSHLHVPLYGLPAGWAGTRLTGSVEFQTGVTRDADGVHGEAHETVELIHESGPSRLSVQSSEYALPVGDEALLDLLASPGHAAQLVVDLAGEQIAFAAAHGPDEWVARWLGYRATITLRGTRWPVDTGLQLVAVTDLAPYHEGRLRMLERRSGFDLHD